MPVLTEKKYQILKDKAQLYDALCAGDLYSEEEANTLKSYPDAGPWYQDYKARGECK